MVTGQVNLQDAVRGTIELHHAGQDLPAGRRDGHPGRPAPGLAPRREALRRVDGEPVSASLFDFGLYVFHNGRESLSRGFGPVLLPAQAGEPPRSPAVERRDARPPRTPSGWTAGSIRATVLIETITAAFEMDEILYELRDHICGLNAGRWDYIFSVAKRFHTDPAFVLPDRVAGDA